MSNPNPNTEGLKQGRGKRRRENNESISMRLPTETRLALEDIAETYDAIYADKPWIAGLLRKIGSGELIVVPAPPTAQSSTNNRKQKIRDHILKKRK